MEREKAMFAAKLSEMTEKFKEMQTRIAELESSDTDEVRRARLYLEAEWADVILELKNRARTMRFITGQQLSQVQLEYCRKAADIMHSSLKQSWSAVAAENEINEAALYAEYTIDFAMLAMRYALMTVATAIDIQNTEETVNSEGN